MSIATQISRLTTLRNNIRTKLISLGLISDQSADLDDCYTAINGVAKKTGSDVVVNNNLVTIPSGFYPTSTTKSAGTTLGATTYNTSTTDQTIPVGKYTTGVQTIKAVTTANIEAGNIKTGVTVKVGDSNSAGRIKNVTGTFTRSTTVSSGQTAASASQIVKGYSAWVNGEEVKGGILSRTSGDMTQSGGTVTAPAGYYASDQSKSIPNGSAATPTTTITSNPAITVGSDGLITAAVSGSQSITPTVTSGYVASGTAGTVSVAGSSTHQLTTKAATTYNVSTSNRTIAAGTYLTGTQTIRGVKITGVDAAYILSGHVVKVGDSSSTGRLKNVTGTYVPYIEFTSVSVASTDWVSDSTYEDYPYRAAIACVDATADMFPYVEFGSADATGDNYYNVAESYAGGVYIYAAEPAATTISKITFYKRG